MGLFRKQWKAHAEEGPCDGRTARLCEVPAEIPRATTIWAAGSGTSITEESSARRSNGGGAETDLFFSPVIPAFNDALVAFAILRSGRR